jgi:hypothetical protein
MGYITLHIRVLLNDKLWKEAFLVYVTIIRSSILEAEETHAESHPR